MTGRRLSELDARARRLAIAHAAGVIGAYWLIIVVLYYLVPVGSAHGVSLVVRLLAIMAVIAVMLVWQIARVRRALYPELQAVRAGGILVVVFLVLFATTYLSMSHAASGTFSQALDHTRALYFTVTVFSTVGFGDITPRTDPARGVVIIQMILDLIVLGLAFRVLFTAARRPVAGRGGDDPE